MNDAVVSVRDLGVVLHTPEGDVPAVEGVSFDVFAGETVGLVGESGSGKSMVLRAILGLLPENASVTGSVLWHGADTHDWSQRDWAKVRGNDLAMVFQDPMSSLDPLRRIGPQLAEGPRTHGVWSRAEAPRRVREALEQVGIVNSRTVARQYPHELSGGMRQRVLIAAARACSPQLLLCDEPTTALDVTVQKQILGLLDRSVRELAVAVVFVSHDLAVVSQMCRDVHVMYAGQIVESGPLEEVFAEPRHAYTAALLASLPRIDGERRRPTGIPGELPNRYLRSSGCRFHRRCTVADERCLNEAYELRAVGAGGLLAGPPVRVDGRLAHSSSCYYDRGIPSGPISPRPAISEEAP